MDQPTPVPIFLDFEGVLRPTFYEGPFFCAKNLVEPLLEAREMGLFPALVIASTYRLAHSWRDLAAMLDSHAPGIGQFICGCTPKGADQVVTLDESKRQAKAPRLFEAQKWMESRGAPLGWIAIDDSAELYGSNYGSLPPELILCDGNQGFTLADAANLRGRLRSLAALRQTLAAEPEPATTPSPRA